MSRHDRSAALPVAGILEQSDGTAWMAMYSLNLLEVALVLAEHDPSYEDLATKFLEHFAYIADAMREQGLWDDEDGFFYDVLSFAGRQPDAAARAFHGRAAPAVRDDHPRPADAVPPRPTSRPPALVRQAQAAVPRGRWRAARARRGRRAAAVVVDADRLVRILTTDARPRTSSCRPTACGPCRGPP